MKQICVCLISLALFVLALSCNDSSSLGADFFPDESFEVQIVDTSTIKLSTLRYDSFSTRQTGRLLVGYHEDPNFGKIKAVSYFQIGMKSSTSYFLDERTTRYDSITLVLRYDSYSHYDTNQLQTLYIHQLTEDVKIPENDTSFYNNSSLTYESKALGGVQFYPRPRRGGVLEIRLDNSLGAALYDYAVAESEVLKDQDIFRDYLKGFALVPDERKSTAIIGFSAAPELRLYYKNTARLPANQDTLIFIMTGDNISTAPGTYFNQIISDRDNTPLSELNNFEYLLSSLSTNHTSFIQGGIGIATRLEIPYLRNMLLADDDFIISKAILQFSPIRDNAQENIPTPRTLTALWVDKDNERISSTTFVATLRIDNEFDRDTYYEMDITSFVKSQIAIEQNNNNALLFQLVNEYRTSVNQLIMGDSQHPQKMQLKIYVISI